MSSFDLGHHCRVWQEHFGLPGLAVSCLREGEIETAFAGSLDLRSGASVTHDSLFQIASIAKLYTAILVLALAERGRVVLDTSITDQLPGFAPHSVDDFRGVAPRRLLNHTSGIDGDFLLRNDLSVDAYLERLSGSRMLFSPGTHWSYGNSGYVLLGALASSVLGCSWQTAVEDILLEPLGLEHAVVTAGKLASFETATGHLWEGSSLQPVREKTFSPSMAAAGSLAYSSATALMEFAQQAIRGATGTSEAVMSRASWQLAMEASVTLPPENALGAQGWGLGFQTFANGTVGHYGGGNGFSSLLVMDPKRENAFCVLTNCESQKVAEFLREAHATLAAAVTGRSVPAWSEPAHNQTASSLKCRTGIFRNSVDSFKVEMADVNRPSEGLRLAILDQEEGDETHTAALLHPIDDNAFARFEIESGVRLSNVVFVGFGEDHAEPGLIVGGRYYGLVQL